MEAAMIRTSAREKTFIDKSVVTALNIHLPVEPFNSQKFSSARIMYFQPRSQRTLDDFYMFMLYIVDISPTRSLGGAGK